MGPRSSTSPRPDRLAAEPSGRTCSVGPVNVPPLLAAATTSYAANCTLGVSVATGVVRTGRWHWIHHALYICTSALTLTAGIALLTSRDERNRRAGALLLPTAVPLAAIPFAGTHSRRHPAVALAAAPFYALALRASARSN